MAIGAFSRLAGRLKRPHRISDRRKADIDYGTYCLSLKEWLAYSGCGLAGCALIAYTFYRSGAAFAMMVPLGLLYPFYKKRELMENRLRKLNLEFKDGILILASFLSAGYSIENTLSRSADELALLHGREAMMVREFETLAAKIHRNQTVEAAFMDFGERSGLDDVSNFVQVFATAKRSGGDLVGIMSHTAGVIRDKVQVREEIYTMTAAKVFEQRIMSMIPFFIVFYIDFTSPGFFNSMYTTTAGRGIMTACLMVYGAGFVMAKMILRIEV